MQIKPPTYTRQLGFCLKPAEADKLARVAAENGQKVGELTRGIISAWLSKIPEPEGAALLPIQPVNTVDNTAQPTETQAGTAL